MTILFVFNYNSLFTHYYAQGWYAVSVLIIMLGTFNRAISSKTSDRRPLLLSIVFLGVLPGIYAGAAWVTYLLFFVMVAYGVLVALLHQKSRGILFHFFGKAWPYLIIVTGAMMVDPLVYQYLPYISKGPTALLNLRVFSSYFGNSDKLVVHSSPLYVLAELIPNLSLVLAGSYLILRDWYRMAFLREAIGKLDIVLHTLVISAMLSFLFDISSTGTLREEEGYLLLLLSVPPLLFKSRKSNSKSQVRRRDRKVPLMYSITAVWILTLVITAYNPANSIYIMHKTNTTAASYFASRVGESTFADAEMEGMIGVFNPMAPISSYEILPVAQATGGNELPSHAQFLYGNSTELSNGLEGIGASIFILTQQDIVTSFVTPALTLKPLPQYPNNSTSINVIYNDGTVWGLELTN